MLPRKGLAVQLPHKKYGTVFLTDIRDDFKENPAEDYQVNQVVRSVLIYVNIVAMALKYTEIGKLYTQDWEGIHLF